MSTASAFDVFDCELHGTQLIEASAGTGKTWNLCGLYLRLLLERDLKVPDILVVTFTNAATAELRERVRSRIADTLARLRGSAPRDADTFVDTLLARWRGRLGLSDAQLQARLPCLRADAVAAGLWEPGAADIDVHALHQGYLRGLRQLPAHAGARHAGADHCIVPCRHRLLLI